MGFKEAVRTCLKQKYVTFSGRASRSEYWYFMLFVFLAPLIPTVIGFVLLGMSDAMNGSGAPVGAIIFFGLAGLFYLGMFLPYISVYVRRFHDRDLSGWWVLGVMIAGAIPYVGVVVSIAAFVITVLKGTEGENRYGPDPLGVENQADVFA